MSRENTVTPQSAPRFPVVMYLLNRDGYHYIQKVTVTGETKLSWTSGPDHALTKYVKRRHEVLTEQDYEDQQWGLEHRFSIGQLVINRIGGKLLRQIADLIGYKPEEGSRINAQRSAQAELSRWRGINYGTTNRSRCAR